ncbi:MAG: RNA methyltransferase, partial [Thermomicrobium sp.]|nr:RNA methyltransferase [Thermomicrobium sp.]
MSLGVTMERTARPITERRVQRMHEVLARRQPDLTVVLENVHDPHNVSAVLRSCDAVGVLTVHLVYTVEPFPQLSENVSGSALKWLDLVFHPSIAECYRTLREQGFTIYATDLRDPSRSLDLYDLDLTAPVALVFGNEQRGVSDEAVMLADGNFVIPMMGMVRSLNISVACAVSLYEALRQRRQAGHYRYPKLSQTERARRLRHWLEREGRRIPDTLLGTL